MPQEILPFSGSEIFLSAHETSNMAYITNEHHARRDEEGSKIHSSATKDIFASGIRKWYNKPHYLYAQYSVV